MHQAVRCVAKLLKDDTGGELQEQAVLVGLIVAAVLGVLVPLGGKVVAAWTRLNAATSTSAPAVVVERDQFSAH